MPNCEILFTKRIPNLALKGSSKEMGFEPRLETFYSSTLTNSKREIVPSILGAAEVEGECLASCPRDLEKKLIDSAQRIA